MSQSSAQQALIHIMVTMSAADRSMTDNELQKIGNIVRNLPVFHDYDPERLVEDARNCGAILQETDGLNRIIANAIASIPENMHETIYALAVEVAAADLVVGQEELRLLQMLRDALDMDKLICAAIERGARARHRTL